MQLVTESDQNNTHETLQKLNSKNFLHFTEINKSERKPLVIPCSSREVAEKVSKIYSKERPSVN